MKKSWACGFGLHKHMKVIYIPIEGCDRPECVMHGTVNNNFKRLAYQCLDCGTKQLPATDGGPP